MHNLDADYLNPAALDRAHEARSSFEVGPALSAATKGEVGTWLQLWKREYGPALEAFEKAISLNPNYCDWRYAAALTYDGQFANGIAVIEDYMRRDPLYPAMAVGRLGIALHMQGRYDEAVVPLREFKTRAPVHRACHTHLAAVYARLGMRKEARAAISDLLAIDPGHCISHHIRLLSPYREQSHNEHLWEGLRTASLPDCVQPLTQ